MTLDQLLAFHAVASLGTFAAAAAELHKSQPAVSKLVQNLEAETGLVLFDRTAYRATLTDAGKLFFERAAQLVADTEALQSFAAGLAGGGEPVVRLVLEAVTPLPPVLAVMREVQALFPAVRYELRTERLAGAMEALRDASADLAITSAHGLDRKTMAAQAFREVRIIPVVRSDHPLARAGSPVPSAVWRQHAQVVLRDSARGELRHSLNVLEGGLRWSVTDVHAKQQIIEAGMGWGGMPEHLVAGGLSDGTLVALTVKEFDVAAIELFTVRRQDRPQGPVAQALWSRLR
ncbi:MAG: LysR family transcriptional regulator [Byssovorax sp.]